MTTFRPDEYTLGAAIVTRLGETGTLALVICILAAITLGFLYVLMRGVPNTTARRECHGYGGPCDDCDDDVPPEVLDRIRDRAMRTVHEEGADE